MIANIPLGTTETTIKTATVTFAMLSMIFCNTTAANATITIYAYPSGGAPATGTIIKDFIVEAYDSYIWTANEKFILATGDKISGLASALSTITVTTNGMEI